MVDWLNRIYLDRLCKSALLSFYFLVQGVKFIRIHFLPKLLFSMHLYLAPWLTATHQQLLNNTLLKIKKDLAYLQLELRACVNQHDGMVYYGVVNNIPDEESKLVRDRWLSHTSTGRIGLGIRWFILDLRSWFRGNDIPSCAVCNEACIKVHVSNSLYNLFHADWLLPMFVTGFKLSE